MALKEHKSTASRGVVRVANIALLAVLLVGIPAITGKSVGALRISSTSAAEQLVLGGLALGTLANLFMALFGFRRRKERVACWAWFAVYGLLFGVALMQGQGWIEFDWLKKSLLWVRDRF